MTQIRFIMEVMRVTLSALVLAYAVAGTPILDASDLQKLESNSVPLEIDSVPPANAVPEKIAVPPVSIAQKDAPSQSASEVKAFVPPPVPELGDETAISAVGQTVPPGNVGTPDKLVSTPTTLPPVADVIASVKNVLAASEKVVAPVVSSPNSVTNAPQTANEAKVESPAASPSSTATPDSKVVTPAANPAAPSMNVPPQPNLPTQVNNVGVPNANVPTQNPNTLLPINNGMSPNTVPVSTPPPETNVPFTFYPIPLFPFPLFPIGSSNIGVEDSESYSIDSYPGPNNTIITEVHKQHGNSPPETTITIEKLPDHPTHHHDVKPEVQQTSVNEHPHESNVVVPTKTVDKKVTPVALEMDVPFDESVLDGKNLGVLISLLEEINRRIDLFKKDIVQVLQPLNVGYGPDGVPIPHRKHSKLEVPPTKTELKPVAPPTKTEAGPEVSPTKTEATTETPTKHEVKPETPTKTDAHPETPTKVEDEKPETSSKVDVPAKIDVPKTTLETVYNPVRVARSPKLRGFGPIRSGRYFGGGSDAHPETPTNVEDKKPETSSKVDVPAKIDVPKTTLETVYNPVRVARSPYRGFGGPYGGGYPYGGGGGYPYGGRRPYFGGGYGSGYDDGWRPLYG